MGTLRAPGARVAALASIGVAAAVSLVATALLLDPPPRDLAVMAATLAGTGAAGAAVAMLAPRWAGRLRLRWQLTLFYAVGLAGLVLNIAVAAGLMFLSPHDLRLVFVLCGYALVATAGPAQLMSWSVSRRFEALTEAAGRIASGDLTARVVMRGADEVAHLGGAFNAMAAALEASRQQREELEQARRDLFAAISHDLRTPLATIRVMVEAIEDGVVSDATTSERYLKTINGEIQRLSLLIDDLFELTTIDSGELRLRLELLRVEEVIAETMDALRPQVELAGIRLAFEPGAGTAPVQADPQRLSRVLYNLVQNAIRHTPSDGAIVLRTAAAPGGVEVAVSDNGEGIAREDVPFVFDRFYRGEKSRSREHGGSGLGLSIARGIVEAHGGRIWVEAGEGRGATFAFTLPAASVTRA